MTHPPDAGARRPPRLRSDAQLVAGARAGCPASGEEIARRYRHQLRAHCARIAGPDGADDAVQEALVKALRALAAGQSPGELRPWLHRIARNAAIDELRRRPGDWEPLDPQIDGVAQPPQIAATRAQLRELLAGVAALPERQRAALRMRVVDERSYDEIALALGAGEGTVRALLHRARRSLREGAAVVLLPFWRVARHGPLTHSSAGAATAVKTGLAIGALASAGAAAVALHPVPAAIQPRDHALAATAPPAVPAVPMSVASVLTTPAARRTAADPARRTAARKATIHAATSARPATASASRDVAARRKPPSTTTSTPADGGSGHAAGGASAGGNSDAGGAAERPGPGSSRPPAGAPTPAPDTSAAASTPAADHGTAPPPATDTTATPAATMPSPTPDAAVPAPTPAPAPRGQISAWTPDAAGAAQGLLAVQSGTNPAIARRVSATTDVRCYRVAEGFVVSFDACPAGALVAGTPVASAEMQSADAGASWRVVYLILAG